MKLFDTKRMWALLLLMLLLTGCARGPERPQVTEPPTEAPTEAPAQPTEATQPTREPARQATLYVGSRAAGFDRYPLTYRGELAPETLIAGLEEQTGWRLPLADAVTSGKGGMTVCWAAGGTLFDGAVTPDQARAMLDSVQKTLQMGFVSPPGDPDALDIYYCMEGDRPLALAAIGKSWPQELPYQWEPGGSLQNIPFTGDQAYAVAFLGWQDMGQLDHYAQKYLPAGELPQYRISDGEYYLVIPRYGDMTLELWQNALEGDPVPVARTEHCTPFVLQCNISDIFPDATVRFARGEEVIAFSPYISLKDGELFVGERGLNIT